MNRLYILMVSVFIVVLAGCSNSKDLPTSPDQQPIQEDPEVTILASGTMDLSTGSVEFDTRSTNAYFDVTTFLGSNFYFTIDGIIPPDVLNITLYINNASPLTVHDVCLVFENLYGKTVKNPDAYMDIFSLYQLQPFIAFRKESPTREFPPGLDTENLRLEYPGGTDPRVDFFIIAHLGGNTGGVYDLLNWGFDGELTNLGGSAVISIRVKDYQDDVTGVVANTNPITGGITIFTQSTGDPEVWEATISNTEYAPVGSYITVVRAGSPSSPHYFTYDYFEIVIEPAQNDPTVFGDDIGIDGDDTMAYPDILSPGHRGMGCSGDNFYLVFWSTDGSDEAAVYFTKSNDGGETWSTAIPLTSETDDAEQTRSNIAVGNGHLYVSYETTEHGYYESKLLHSDDDGSSWTDHEVTLSEVGSQDDPNVCVDTTTSPETVYVAFVSHGNGESLSCAQTTNDNLDEWIVAEVSDYNMEYDTKFSPSIIYNEVSSMVMVTWTDYTATVCDGNRIYFDKSTDGINWNDDTLITSSWSVSDREWESSLAYNPVTGVPAVLYRYWWDLFRESEIRFVKANNNTASSWGWDSRISNMSTQIYGSSLGCDNNGRWVAAWFADPNEIRHYDCMYDESLDDGATWGLDVRVNDPTYPEVFNPTVAVNSLGDVCVAWSDKRSGDFEIYVDHGVN